MGFALIYLSEHDLSDVLAGVLPAAVAWLAAAWTRHHYEGDSEEPTATERAG